MADEFHSNGRKIQLDLTHVNLGTVVQLVQTIVIVVGGMWALFTFVNQVEDLKETVKPLVATVSEIDKRTTIIDTEQKLLTKRIDRIENKIDAQDEKSKR